MRARLEAFLGAMQRFGRDLPLRACGFELGRELTGFEIEPAIGLDGALALGRRGFERRAERGNRVEHRVEIRALALDILFGSLDVLLRAGVVVGRRRGERRGFVASGRRFRGRLAARVERQPFRLAARLQLLPLDLELVGALRAAFPPAAYRAQSAAGGG